MELIIGFVLLVIVLIIVGLILRKKVYDRVDQLEAWKLDIMSRNVAAELSKIKSLNLSGETQMKFETWKERWENIVGTELADIEEHLLDAEDAADYFRILKGKKILAEAEEILKSVEKSIDGILEELDELLDSEKSSREEVEDIEPLIKVLKRKISQNRYQFGKGDVFYEAKLETLETDLEQYEVEVAEGNYIEAKKIVEQMNLELEQLKADIDAYPDIYKKAKHELPTQLDQLLAGLKEMRADGYYIEHLQFDEEIVKYERRLNDVINTLEKGELQTGTEILSEIEERISEMYDLLEEEAVAKSYLENHISTYENAVLTLDATHLKMKEDVEELRKAYFVEDEEIEKFLDIGKKTQHLKDELNSVLESIEKNNTAHTALRSMIEAGLKQTEELEEKHLAFQENISSLRKDELDAKDKIGDMRIEITDLHRRLRNSNIPGVPTFIWTSLEETQERNKRVLEALDQNPLDTNAVHRALEEAERAIEHTTEQIDMMLDQAYLTEQVIQYANRYRSRNAELRAELVESERLFRTYEYELSLERAAKAIEEVEPGALKRIEEAQKAVQHV